MKGPTETDLEAELRASQRRKARGSIVTVAILFTGIAAFVGWYKWRDYASTHRPHEAPLTSEQRAALVAQIARSRELIAAADGQWRAAIERVDPMKIAGRGPQCSAIAYSRRGLAENPQSSSFGSWEILELPIDQFKGGGTASLTRAPFPITFIKAGEPIPEQSPEARLHLRQLKRMEAGLDEPTNFSFEERLRAARIEKLRADNVLLRIEAVKEAEELPSGSRYREEFEGGVVIASVWVFDQEARRVICAGSFAADSSSKVQLGVSSLNDDLLINLLRKIPDGAHEVPAGSTTRENAR
jgi:hypothetical protein